MLALSSSKEAKMLPKARELNNIEENSRHVGLGKKKYAKRPKKGDRTHIIA